MREKFGQLMFIVAMFPWVSFGTNNMDTQPWLFVMLLFLFIFNLAFGVKNRFIVMAYLPIFALLVGLSEIGNYDFLTLRGVVSYTGFYLALVVMSQHIEKFGPPIRIVVQSNIIYLLAATFQLTINPNIFNFLVSINAGSHNRGVSSLTPEATYFGIILFFFSWILLIIYRYKPPLKIKYLIYLNIFFIFFVAKSSMAIVFLLLCMTVYSVYSLSRGKIKLVIIFFIIITGGVIAVNFFMPETRISQLTNKYFSSTDYGVIDSILSVIQRDASINDRVSNVVFSIYGFFYNLGIPGGYHSFSEMTLLLAKEFNGFFWFGFGSDKVMSFFGSFVYELGILGLLIIAHIFYLISNRCRKERFYELLVLFVIMNSAISVLFPLFPLLIVLLYLNKIDLSTVRRI